MCGDCCCSDKSDEKTDLVNPTKNRRCTDIPVLIIFIVFWIGMIYIAAFSITHGDAFRLVYGYDSFGNTCDEDNSQRPVEHVNLSGRNMKGKPYVFFMDMTNPVRSLAICVNKCPDRTLLDIDDVHTFSQQTGSMLCRYDVDVLNYTKTKEGMDGPCPKTPVPPSEPLLNRCVPSNYTVMIDFLNESDTFRKVLSDMYTSWREMLVLCFIALGFSVLMVLLIRFLASVIVYVIITVAVIGSIAGTAFLWWTFASFNRKLNEDNAIGIPLLQVEIDSEIAFLVFAIIATVLIVILLLVLLIMRKRISLVVTLFHEAGKCLVAMPLLLVQSLWTFVILLLFFIYWVIVLAYLSTSDIPSRDRFGHVKYDDHELVSYFWWYHVIGLIWTSEFIIACQQLVISGAVARWYFAREKNQLSCVICNSIGHLCFYHLGSIAYGALIITLVKLPRWILMYLEKKTKNSQNSCAACCLKCCTCCLWCLEKCLKYLNQNSYTVIAIQGTGFCSSTKKAFLTLVSNSLRVAALNSVGDFMLFLGKIGVTASTGAVGILWLKSRGDLHYYAVPVLLICVFAYFIAHSFLSVYEMVVDAILLCFCHDSEINDGSPERPYFASSALLEYMDSSSRKLNMLKKEKGDAEAEPVSV
ncbi:hypothetical protein ScPMuIL_000427 [Solemya velum]